MKVKYLLIVFLFAQALFAQKKEEFQNQFIVLGSVELNEVADQASFSFTIKGVGSSLREAVGSASKKTADLTENIIALGVKPNNISTAQFFSGENFGDKSFLSSSKDFRAQIETSIKVDSLKLLQSLLFKISEAGVESISQIIYSYKDELGLRRKARVEAGLKAREKAEDIAKGLGATIGKVLFVEEIIPNQTFMNNVMVRNGGMVPNPFNPAMSGGGTVDESRGSGFFAQTVSFSSQVRVIFEIK